MKTLPTDSGGSGSQSFRPKWFRPPSLRAALFLACAVLPSAAGPASNREGSGREVTQELKQLSLEELMNVKVSSVSKKEQSVSSSPAAIHVITQEDIRRSGAATLPEALRLAPGLNVARVNAHQWAVSSRGFNNAFANKLLVLMDGRSLYTPLFSGTLWQAQTILLEDIDRIEVIRGPGGTLWGANAVNGVINIVTKPARDTQGFLISGGGGSQQHANAAVRYGGTLGANAHLRVYGGYGNWADSPLAGGGTANDAWWRSHGGFRLDWDASDRSKFTLQSDVHGLSVNQTVPQIVFPRAGTVPPASGYTYTRRGHWDQQGGNVLARWTVSTGSDSELSVQTYYDRSNLEMPLMTQTLDTVDWDLRHRFQWGSRQEIVWGGGYRLSESEVRGSPEVEFSRGSRSDQLGNAFVRDEIELVPDRLRLAVGTKVEHNDFTGFEVEPGASLAWTPHSKHLVWASVARAVRTPSQIERDGRINLSVLPAAPPARPLPTLISVAGNSGFQSEKLIAYELGVRSQLHDRLTLDVAGFIHSYDDLRGSIEQVDFSSVPNYVQIVSSLDNSGHGSTWGGEVAAAWQAAGNWRLQAHYSMLQPDLERISGGVALGPRHQASLRSLWDVTPAVQFDAWLRYVDRVASSGVQISALPTPGATVRSYVTLDLRLAWRPIDDLELSITGQNLLESRHREFNPTFISTEFTEIPRSVYGKVTWHF